MKGFLLQHADPIALGAFAVLVAIGAFCFRHIHAHAISRASRLPRADVVKPSRPTAATGNIFTTWEAGRRG